ncbi:division/cell wall cluster transcriptional repressor MraZ [Desulfonatronovibrio magnus]|uniref:division/cell wall cluster transcriptional repressor MraZ n=1 Tax=Desulfonatronovibrio magnus TaxID=698827 RepID=UPI0005EB3189|nr:division/cell wall cluster transcriptional repressor MraZ [Desulfonatronovibrio magnus]RQD67958.1 MAG: division/cell wall cluster transcriptional repressor MraZ [Desulfonatronovibrio sp. MSAO_Bac4]
MFRGHSQRSIDPKGRLMLPPDFREVIMEQAPGGELMITNFDDCVVAYPLPEWEEIEQSFNRLNMANRKFRDFHRFFISGATQTTLDKQGRILVPPYLRTYAEITKEVVLAGVGRKFEIWDLTRFEAQRKKMEQDFDGIMDSLAENGFELRF